MAGGRKEVDMFVIAGASGRTGRVVGETLLSQRQQIRVIVRSEAKAASWRERGAEAAIGSLDDARFIERTLEGAKAFFTLLPEDPTATDFHAHRRHMADAIGAGVKVSGIPHVVFLSAIAAYLSEGSGPAKDLWYAESTLARTGAVITTLRASYFQENAAAVLPAVVHEGVFPNFLPSADIAFPMVATGDVGRFAARCMVEPPSRSEVVDLLGACSSIREIADKLAAGLGKSVKIVDLPPAAHVEALTRAGLPTTFAEAVAEMYACFASGRVEPHGDRQVRTATTLDETLAALLAGLRPGEAEGR
jgi:uncharacterized protein YbjT (DUF2867 family)